jgi:hypothetical protein
VPKFIKQKNFFEEYWKLYLQNDQLIQKLIKEEDERSHILNKIIKIEVRYILTDFLLDIL